ncbi:Inner membrane protein yccF [Porphyromonas cangingivalis]|uniref:Uncharacterized membrane protein YccF, DUF307 family n=2 Tax=Porphyromonas cangingivalis TaxID=36874 RepID=A0A1T4KS82_PORCN|nr:Uncharacterized membrane protein YccF, DUF307 family [Porphyromonas cangingivalis]VEJ02423.1 Inner membrane protein yccF [Porphyromonas cangingivalis]
MTIKSSQDFNIYIYECIFDLENIKHLNYTYLSMKLIGNLVWLVLGGLEVALEYFLVGVILCITIIGVPFGIQCFKLGVLMLWPFGSHVSEVSINPLGCVGNLIWFIFAGWIIALTHFIFGILLCITIVGIPFGLKHFTFAGLALTPFGREITNNI